MRRGSGRGGHDDVLAILRGRFCQPMGNALLESVERAIPRASGQSLKDSVEVRLS